MFPQNPSLTGTSPLPSSWRVLRGLPLLTAFLRFQQPAVGLEPSVERQRDRRSLELPLAGTARLSADSCVLIQPPRTFDRVRVRSLC